MTDEELIQRAREMWQWKHGHRTYPSAEEVDALLRAVDERDEFAWALVQIMDGMQDHDIGGETGLPASDCERIAAARKRSKEITC